MLTLRERPQNKEKYLLARNCTNDFYVWNISDERKIMGHWSDTNNVPEEFFLEFLRNTFIKNIMDANSVDTAFAKFSSNLARNKIILELGLLRRVAVLRTAWKNLSKAELTRELEKKQVDLAFNFLWMGIGVLQKRLRWIC
jgi:hypothetical protein